MSWAFAEKKDIPETRKLLTAREWECAALTGRLKDRHGRLEIPDPAKARLALRREDGHIRQALYMASSGLTIPYLPGLDLADSNEADALRDIFFQAWGTVSVLVGLKAFVDAFGSCVRARPVTCVDYYLMRALEPPPGASSLEIPQIQTRQAQGKDFEALLPLQEAYAKEEILINPDDFDMAKTRKELKYSLTNHIIYIALANGQIIAKGGTNSRGFTYDQIGGVYTCPEYRRKRVARFLMNNLLTHIFSQGKRACLFVKTHNLPAIRLYDSLGFRIAENYRISYF